MALRGARGIWGLGVGIQQKCYHPRPLGLRMIMNHRILQPLILMAWSTWLEAEPCTSQPRVLEPTAWPPTGSEAPRSLRFPSFAPTSGLPAISESKLWLPGLAIRS